jgi:hypothetical protein
MQINWPVYLRMLKKIGSVVDIAQLNMMRANLFAFVVTILLFDIVIGQPLGRTGMETRNGAYIDIPSEVFNAIPANKFAEMIAATINGEFRVPLMKRRKLRLCATTSTPENTDQKKNSQLCPKQCSLHSTSSDTRIIFCERTDI